VLCISLPPRRRWPCIRFFSDELTTRVKPVPWPKLHDVDWLPVLIHVWQDFSHPLSLLSFGLEAVDLCAPKHFEARQLELVYRKEEREDIWFRAGFMTRKLLKRLITFVR